MQNSIHNIFTSSIFLMLLSGCSPLQQAPLAYSSKTTVGIDISATTTENPGVSINIGVKSIDAAYVPVAVSKEIDSKATGYDLKTVEIMRIAAEFGQGGATKSQKSLSDENKRKITEFLNARLDEEAANKSAGEVESKLTEAKSLASTYSDMEQRVEAAKMYPQNSLAEVQKLAIEIAAINGKAPSLGLALITAKVSASTEPSSPPPQEASSTPTAPITPAAPAVEYDYVPMSKSLAAHFGEESGKVAKLKPILVERTTDKIEKAKRAAALFDDAAKAADLGQTKKIDALSVYGRFDANGSANAKVSDAAGDKAPTSATVLVGKVFSTGLASQNLTEAVKIEAASRCLAKVIELINLATAAEKPDLAKKLAGTCAEVRHF